MNTMNRLIRMSLALALLAGATPLATFAAPPPPADTDADAGPPLPDWEHLSAQQRELLIAPMRQRWNDAPQQRRRMFEHAQRWQSMTPEQRERARKGARRYADMSPQQREEARVLFERMRALPNLSVLFGGHGPAVAAPYRKIDEYISHRLEREQHILQAVREGETDPKQIVARVYTDVSPKAYAMAERAVLAHLEKLREDGAVATDQHGQWQAI